ncbi:dihydrofolate reductase [Sutcliffiella horikoshii]|uniref:Dihydrofolate reductase n=1 Tax=Sutcliffiella horikoshii TaxID=79883 RepID=A0A1Y0CN75_9BACI|nr:dihydrofolate reductase [Sutcliffiella horikoshii]ART76761.1 dihydrofolate reductase [Sutcliffiella horikoshii]TYS58151.1 dihydrofolate reductase [Sutcliffiella horikoshii]
MISIIVATDKNNLIGKDNDLPWRIPADLAYFKKVTLNSTIVMGRKTYESIGKPLPKRRNIILSRQDFHADGCETLHSIEEVESLNVDGEELFIIGGAHIFMETLPIADFLYLTYIEEEFEGDTYFPEINEQDWELIYSEKGIRDEKNPYDYYFKKYKRIGLSDK